MGRRPLRRRLGVWMNGWLTGTWERGTEGESFAYDPGWMES
jgi:serine/threonine-protein kinase HipA